MHEGAPLGSFADAADTDHEALTVTNPGSYDGTYGKLVLSATGSYTYGLAPNTTLPGPAQLPDVFNKLQQFKIDVRHRVSSRLRASISYLYEPFDVFDFAFDPTVIDSIIQPSSMVLGYVYRPYTAHSAVASLIYAW